ncbi:MAG: HlyC/CorC family transporter [Candidatus Omnitrophica bacterium]|nr:HlyC/CorC family transporter [Candidatus Omnitrophota bacterium]
MVFTYSFIIIILMLALNAVFAAYEMALASVTRARLKGLIQEKRKGSEEALFMKERIEGSLAVIQVGITVVGAVAAAVGGAGVDDAMAPFLVERFKISLLIADIMALIVFIIPLCVFTIIFGELVPKNFALKNREWVCLKLSPSMKTLYYVFFPVVSFLEWIVKLITDMGTRKIEGLDEYSIPNVHELKAAASVARASRLIGIREEKIVHSAVELSTRSVREIILPVDEIFAIPIDIQLVEVLIRAHKDMHTRFPVCTRAGDPQSITGYVNFKDIIYVLHSNPSDPSLKSIVRPVKSFYGDMKISAVMEEMIQGGQHIGLIKEKSEKIIGMVTLEDILEELVGEIHDEYDRLPAYVNAYGIGWVMGGGVPLEKVAQATGVALSKLRPEGVQGLNTLAQWCQYVTKGELKGAEAFYEGGLSVTVRKFRRKQVLEAFVELA